jgi:hypothetical protein
MPGAAYPHRLLSMVGDYYGDLRFSAFQGAFIHCLPVHFKSPALILYDLKSADYLVSPFTKTDRKKSPANLLRRDFLWNTPAVASQCKYSKYEKNHPGATGFAYCRQPKRTKQ